MGAGASTEKTYTNKSDIPFYPCLIDIFEIITSTPLCFVKKIKALDNC